MKSSHTRDDVARVAGVSSATVSRVFNMPERVSPDKVQAVLHAAGKLGYTPNKSASTLRRQGTGTITLLEFRKPERPYYWGNSRDFNWFYADVIRGIHAILRDTAFTLELQTIDDPADIVALQDTSDGILCYDTDRREEIEAVSALGIPYVLAHHTESYAGYTHCSTDNRAGGYLQARYLHQSGVTAPLYITSFLDTVPQHAERLAGFRSCCSEHGISEPMILEFSDEPHSELAIARYGWKLLEAGACDGVAAVNDISLARFCNSIIMQGSSGRTGLFPMCGYDAAPFRHLLPYAFASVDIRPAEIYRRATACLVRMLSAGSPASVGEPAELTVTPELVLP